MNPPHSVALDHLRHNRLAEAEAILRPLVAADAGDVVARRALGLVLSRKLDDPSRLEGVELLRRFEETEPTQDAEVICSLAHALRMLGRPAEAVPLFKRAAGLRPRSADVLNNLGVTFQDLGDVDASIQTLSTATRLNPGHAEAHWNLSLALLLSGDWRRGWAEYEWRRQLPTDVLKTRPLPHPVWNGCDVQGMTLLLRCEQGLGDAIQFIRYARLVKERVGEAGRVIVEAHPPLVALLSRAEGVDRVIARGQPLPAFDLQVPLLSLPGIFHTTVENVPAGAYLRSKARIQHRDTEVTEVAQRRELGVEREGGIVPLKVGIAWQGSATYGGDRQRSIALEEFAPLARVGGVRLFSLQKGRGVEQIEGFNELVRCTGGVALRLFDPPLDEAAAGAFLETAQVIGQLDLVITSDTAIAHLAGARGAAVWVALPHAADWRWLTGRSDSPWYPTMRLYRQTTAGDWAEVFARMAADLAAMAPVMPETQPVTIETIPVPLAPGEILDRLSILNLKAERITEPARRARVLAERENLRSAAVAIPQSDALEDLFADLTEVNQTLWDVEDELRAHESRADFGPRFVALARAVYHANDQRADLKRQINALLGSTAQDEKAHPAYPHPE